jgi:anti-sigma B factor antagonist
VNSAPFEASAAQLDGGVRVIEVRGELDLSTAPQLEGPLEEAVADGEASVLIDLSECEFIDSTGIALIVRSWQRVAQDGDKAVAEDGNSGSGSRNFVICTQNEQVCRVLEITGLELSIPIHGSRDEALAALRD